MEMICVNVTECIWFRIGSSAGCCEHSNEPSSFSNLYGEGVPDSVTEAVSKQAVTEQMCSTVFHPGACISNFESDAKYHEIYRVFPHSLHSDAGIMSRNIMTSPFQLLSNSLLICFCKTTLYS
jgi:hypothetical protein